MLSTEAHRPLLSESESIALCRVPDSGHNTPLHIAALKGHIEEVKILLLMKCIKVDARNDAGKTPLHLASEAGHVV